MNAMARFSVVVPTYNRASLLQHSLPTALEQTFDDYEIVVSDNASTDETADVLSGFSSNRLRVVRPDRCLSMVDHWEFALGHATGEWVLFLCDDDALLPNCLARLDAIIREAGDHELVQYDRFRYVYGDGVQADGNYVEVGSRVRLPLRTIESSRRLFTVFWRLSIEMPKMLNCAARSSLIARLRARHGRVFGLWAPDIQVGVRLLAATPRYLKTGPLMLWGENLESYGSGAGREPSRMLQFFRQFPEFQGTLPLSPYPGVLTVTNSIYDTLCRLKRDLGQDYAHLEIDPVRFRLHLLQDIERYLERGHAEYLEDRDRIRGDLRRFRLSHGLNPWRAWKRVAARARSFPEKFQRIAAGRKTVGPKRRHRFSNIHEAAQYVGRLAEP